jgi:hypothetical protein
MHFVERIALFTLFEVEEIIINLDVTASKKQRMRLGRKRIPKNSMRR